MKAPETKTEGLADDAPFEVTWEGGLEAPSPEAATAGDALADRRPSLWDALVGWGYGEPERRVVPQSASRWRLDEEDFSAEHGYESGFEGRSEFEHGDFERWT